MNSTFKFPASDSKRGAALIIALAIMVLIMGLVVGILSRVTTERTSVGGYASSVNARLLGDSVLQIVQAQINAATAQSGTMTWSSQPGLIRTYDNNGNPSQSYKLYSSSTMQVNGAISGSSEAQQLSNWFSSPALYTDLNQPVCTTSSTTWPILNPSGTAITSGSSMITGFSITNAPVGADTGVTNPAPMPVQWIYVLQDGQIVAPSAGSTGTSAVISGASGTNPIVGRIAFWTDDETCKLNINTASEGEYWDTPKFHTNADVRLSLCQPVKNEFQGYPGHPAGVSLSTVFHGASMIGSATASMYNSIYNLVPRIQPGGSQNGTVTSSTATPSVVLDTDRLYPNVSELMFTSTTSGTTRTQNTGLSPSDVENASFFITACSRAPELTPFGTPKIVCWPISSINDSAHRSAFDNLIAFCGTLAGQPYYFQRMNKNSATDDYNRIPRNQVLYSYLQTLLNKPIPGFGGNLANKFGLDKDQIITEIFEYIRCTNLNDLNIPTANQYGTGDNYGHGQDEVIPIVINDTRGFGRYLTINEAAIQLICTASGTANSPSNNPVSNNTLATNTPLTNVPGASYQLRIEASLILDFFTPMHQAVTFHPDITVLIDGMQNWTIHGNSPGGDPAVNFGFPAQSAQTSNSAGIYQLGDWPGNSNSTYDTGGYMGTNWAWQKRGVRTRNGGRLTQDTTLFNGHSPNNDPVFNQQNPFVSEPVTVNVAQSNPQLIFSGGPITITILQRSTGTVVQTLNINFQGGILQPPGAPLTATGYTLQASGSYNTASAVIASMVAARSLNGSNQTLDPRILAMTGTVPVDFFLPHPFYNGQGNYQMAHSFISNAISGQGGFGTSTLPLGMTGALFAGGTYGGGMSKYQILPKVPYPTPSAQNNGDWDNGLGELPDGGFLNAPDQGNISNTWASPYYDNHQLNSANFTSPSRTIPSPGMFGSLPTGVKRNLGWQTLLFRRQPGHPSYPYASGQFSNQPDYILLDYFWMPVVEPYAISEPLSTAGKINLNYQIIPFTYIERSTGIYAVLQHEKLISIPKADAGIYKAPTTPPAYLDDTHTYRSGVTKRMSAFLKQFQQRFDNSDGSGFYAFRSPAEVCELHFIPDPINPPSSTTSSKTALDNYMSTYWQTNSLTGDNSRERIYTTVYPRLTTKSNTFTVHYRVQVLKQVSRITDLDKWFENRDTITSDYRGSTTIERYIDPKLVTTDYASNPDATPSLETLYRWRQRENRQFTP